MAKWRWTTKHFDIDATALGGPFDRLIREMYDGKPFLEVAGMVYLEAVREAFERGVDPGTMTPWARNRPNTVAAKGHGRVLERSRRLKRSFTRGATGNVFSLSGKRLKVGSRLKVAHYAHEGTRPHTIVPKKKTMLRFKTAGGWAFARKVAHPGTPPRPLIGVHRSTAAEITRRQIRLLDQIASDRQRTGV